MLGYILRIEIVLCLFSYIMFMFILLVNIIIVNGIVCIFYLNVDIVIYIVV